MSCAATSKVGTSLRDIPVILLTSLSDPEDVILALECGADNFVTKPFSEELLINRIHAVLLNKKLERPEG